MGNKPNDAAREPRLSPSIKDLAAKAKQAAAELLKMLGTKPKPQTPPEPQTPPTPEPKPKNHEEKDSFDFFEKYFKAKNYL